MENTELLLRLTIKLSISVQTSELVTCPKISPVRSSCKSQISLTRKKIFYENKIEKSKLNLCSSGQQSIRRVGSSLAGGRDIVWETRRRPNLALAATAISNWEIFWTFLGKLLMCSIEQFIVKCLCLVSNVLHVYCLSFKTRTSRNHKCDKVVAMLATAETDQI